MKRLMLIALILLGGCATHVDKVTPAMNSMGQVTMALQMAEMQKLIWEFGVQTKTFEYDKETEKRLENRANDLRTLATEMSNIILTYRNK